MVAPAPQMSQDESGYDVTMFCVFIATSTVTKTWSCASQLTKKGTKVSFAFEVVSWSILQQRPYNKNYIEH